jgi:hypothetical protein
MGCGSDSMLTIFLDSPKSSSSVADDEEHDSMKLLVAIKINADKRLFFIFVSFDVSAIKMQR